MLQKYRENPWENWRDKDTVLYLVTSLASKGQTQRHGTTQTNQLVDLTSFATEHILPELQKDTGMCFINHLYVMVFVSVENTYVHICTNFMLVTYVNVLVVMIILCEYKWSRIYVCCRTSCSRVAVYCDPRLEV
jgi:hypothetical protein